MISRSDKELIVKDLQEKFKKSKAVFLTNLVGVEANVATKIRKGVRDAEGSLVVTRNTLFRLAAKGTSAEKLLSGLKGTNAVAFAYNDAPAVAKVIFDASKESEIVELKGGFLGDQELSKADFIALASLPSRDQMLATLLATFNAPASAFVRVLNAIKEQKETTVA